MYICVFFCNFAGKLSNCVKMKRKIAIIAGGDSSEYGVSLRSAAGIYSFLDKDKYDITIVKLRGVAWQALAETGKAIAENNGTVPEDNATWVNVAF